MKTTYRFMGLLGSLVYFGAGGHAYANAQFTPDGLLEHPSAITNLEPPAVAPGPGREFSMSFVQPAPDIDYKIVQVTPDPDIDYSIRVTGPMSKDSLLGTNDLTERLSRKDRHSK